MARPRIFGKQSRPRYKIYPDRRRGTWTLFRIHNGHSLPVAWGMTRKEAEAERKRREKGLA